MLSDPGHGKVEAPAATPAQRKNATIPATTRSPQSPVTRRPLRFRWPPFVGMPVAVIRPEVVTVGALPDEPVVRRTPPGSSAPHSPHFALPVPDAEGTRCVASQEAQRTSTVLVDTPMPARLLGHTRRTGITAGHAGAGAATTDRARLRRADREGLNSLGPGSGRGGKRRQNAPVGMIAGAAPPRQRDSMWRPRAAPPPSEVALRPRVDLSRGAGYSFPR